MKFPVPYGQAISGYYLPHPQLSKYPDALLLLQRRLIDFEMASLIVGIRNGGFSIHAGAQASSLASEAVALSSEYARLKVLEVKTDIPVPAYENEFGSYSAGNATLSSVSLLPLPF